MILPADSTSPNTAPAGRRAGIDPWFMSPSQRAPVDAIPALNRADDSRRCRSSRSFHSRVRTGCGPDRGVYPHRRSLAPGPGKAVDVEPERISASWTVLDSRRPLPAIRTGVLLGQAGATPRSLACRGRPGVGVLERRHLPPRPVRPSHRLDPRRRPGPVKAAGPRCQS